MSVPSSCDSACLMPAGDAVEAIRRFFWSGPHGNLTADALFDDAAAIASAVLRACVDAVVRLVEGRVPAAEPPSRSGSDSSSDSSSGDDDECSSEDDGV